MFAVGWVARAVVGVGSGTIERVGVVGVVGGASLAAYLGVAMLLRAEELNSALALLRRRSEG
jgi:hypothetical protein